MKLRYETSLTGIDGVTKEAARRYVEYKIGTGYESVQKIYEQLLKNSVENNEEFRNGLLNILEEDMDPKFIANFIITE